MRSSPTRTRRPGTTSTAMRALTPTSAPGAFGGGFDGSFDFGDLGTSSAAFSAAASAAGGAIPTPQRGASIRMSIAISFEEAAFGCEGSHRGAV